MRIPLTITGRGYDVADAPTALELADGAPLSVALRQVRERMARGALNPTTLVIISGKHVGTLSAHDDMALKEGDELLLLQPVAGG